LITIIQTYGKAFLYSDGYNMTGVAMTLWLLVSACIIGFCLAVPLAIARNSKSFLVRAPVWLYCFVFTGTPLYTAWILCTMCRASTNSSALASIARSSPSA
jgi:histidine transport system permease protein